VYLVGSYDPRYDPTIYAFSIPKRSLVEFWVWQPCQRPFFGLIFSTCKAWWFAMERVVTFTWVCWSVWCLVQISCSFISYLWAWRFTGFLTCVTRFLSLHLTTSQSLCFDIKSEVISLMIWCVTSRFRFGGNRLKAIFFSCGPKCWIFWGFEEDSYPISMMPPWPHYHTFHFAKTLYWSFRVNSFFALFEFHPWIVSCISSFLSC